MARSDRRRRRRLGDPRGRRQGGRAQYAGADGSLRPDRAQPLFHQHGLGAGHGLPRHVHAGGVRDGGDGYVPRQELGSHLRHELHDLPAGWPGLLGLRLRVRLGKLVQRARSTRLVLVAWSGHVGAQPRHRAGGEIWRHRHQGLLSRFLGGRYGRSRAVLLHDGVHGHHGHHPHGRDGRTLGVEELRALRLVGCAALLHLRELGLGRRLARAGRRQLAPRARRRRLRRLGRRARDGRRDRSGGRDRHRTANRQVHQRQATNDPWPPPTDGDRRLLHPRVRLVRVQPRLDARRNGPAHRIHRRQHDAGELWRSVRGHGLSDDAGPQA